VLTLTAADRSSTPFPIKPVIISCREYRSLLRQCQFGSACDGPQIEAKRAQCKREGGHVYDSDR
jgi:hypothetical protein